MMLGTLIARLESEESAAEAIAALGDLPLYAEVAAMAERYGETPGEFVAASAASFANLARDEDWQSLIAAVERAEAPGAAALQRLVRWALARVTSEPLNSATSSCSCRG